MGKRKPRRLTAEERQVWTLDAVEAADGVQAALDNGRRLAEDARTLHDEGGFPSALALAVLAVEELDKVGLITQMWHARQDPGALDRLVDDFRNHRVKNTQMLVARPATSGLAPDQIEQIKAKFGPQWASFFEKQKHKHLYLDRTEDGWTVPSAVWPSAESASLNTDIYVRVAESLVRYWAEVVPHLAETILADGAGREPQGPEP